MYILAEIRGFFFFYSVKSHQASECSLIFISACDEGPGLCAHLITFLSILLVFVTIPFLLCISPETEMSVYSS